MRGAATLAANALFFCAAELLQRTVVVALIKIRPGLRQRILTGWIRMVDGVILGIVRIAGGARMQIHARIPARSGILVLMNHQSLLDIPVAIRCVEDGYPMIVARERYRSGYPLVSHMIRLYGHPTVRPGEHVASQLESLKRAAAGADRPLLIYPEGSRTHNGEIRPFKTAGIKAILEVGTWLVYGLVVDGLSKAAGLEDFVKNVSSIAIRAESVGPFAFNGSNHDVEAFIESVRERMVEKLAEMRSVEAAG